MDSIIQSLQVRRIQVPYQPSGRSSHPVRTTCHPIRTLDRPVSSVRTKCSFRPDPILYREVSVPASIRPDVLAARPDASQYSISFWFLSKFQEREDQSTFWTMWYPVRTCVSLRQESQLKYDRPDDWQLWSGRACIKEGNCQFDFNRPDDCLSWSGHTHCSYRNCVLKNSRLDSHPPWSRRSKAL
jgi:hypothetical protein